MKTKNEDLESSKRLYAEYLKGRKKSNNDQKFEAGFDFGYEKGMWSAWLILQRNRDAVIEEQKKYCGILKNYHASSVCHRLMDLVSEEHDKHECYEKYKPIECFCEKCGKLK